MAPLKFEKQFKEKLEQQRIRPSAKSWEKLEARLDKNDKKSAWVWRTGLAASIVGGILILSVVFNRDQVPQKVKIVNQADKVQPHLEERKPNTTAPWVSDESGAVIASEINVKDKDSKKPTSDSAITAHANPRHRIQTQNKKHVAPIPKKEAPAVFSTEKSVAGTSSEVELKVTDAEVEALLKEARLRLSPKILEGAKNQISAQALLEDIETELNRSFRDKIFSTLEEKLLEFALASRNN